MNGYIVVTGSNRGIGKAIADFLFEKDFKVIGIDKNKGEHRFPQVVCDLSDWETTAIELKKIIGEQGKVCGLINNAALQIEKDILNTTLNDLNTIFSANVFSIYSLTQILFPYLNESASIINISSVHAHATSKNLSAYVASKGAVSALTRSMALELGAKGVRVNAICPGATESEMLSQGLSRNGNAEDALENLKKSSPLNKIGKGSDIAKMVYFLLDEDLSGNITGQEFVVDSGVLARLASE